MKKLIGYCKECGSKVHTDNVIKGHSGLFECTFCGHPQTKEELWSEGKRLIIFVGESGSGKTTLVDALSKKYGYEVIVSHTTRPIRDGEVEGADYHFRIPRQLELDIQFERAYQHTEFAGNYYWTVEEQYNFEGTRLVVLAPESVKQVKDKFDGEVIIIYLKTDYDVRKQRMFDRGSYSNREEYLALIDKIMSRLNNDEEVFRVVECDYVIDNNGLMDNTISIIEQIIL
jgi:guanylate kinase